MSIGSTCDLTSVIEYMQKNSSDLASLPSKQGELSCKIAEACSVREIDLISLKLTRKTFSATCYSGAGPKEVATQFVNALRGNAALHSSRIQTTIAALAPFNNPSQVHNSSQSGEEEMHLDLTSVIEYMQANSSDLSSNPFKRSCLSQKIAEACCSVQEIDRISKKLTLAAPSISCYSGAGPKEVATQFVEALSRNAALHSSRIQTTIAALAPFNNPSQVHNSSQSGEEEMRLDLTSVIEYMQANSSDLSSNPFKRSCLSQKIAEACCSVQEIDRISKKLTLAAPSIFCHSGASPAEVAMKFVEALSRNAALSPSEIKTTIDTLATFNSSAQ